MANTGSAEAVIAASPEQIYEMVADVTRTGEWSPGCYKCEWEDGATGPAVGAKFRGYNRRGEYEWDVLCTVITADHGREFAFSVGSEPGTTWRYEFFEHDAGTRVVESFASPLLDTPRFVERREKRMLMLTDGMENTLANLKAKAEAG